MVDSIPRAHIRLYKNCTAILAHPRLSLFAQCCTAAVSFASFLLYNQCFVCSLYGTVCSNYLISVVQCCLFNLLNNVPCKSIFVGKLVILLGTSRLISALSIVKHIKLKVSEILAPTNALKEMLDRTIMLNEFIKIYKTPG